MGSRPMKRKKNLLRVIILINKSVPKFPKQTECKLFKIVVQEMSKERARASRAREKKKKSRKSFRKVNLYFTYSFT